MRLRYIPAVTSFVEATSSRRLDDRTFALDVPDGWQQGRGAYGGYVLATIVRAVEAVHATPERRLRTLTAELAGPLLPGAATIELDPLRVGSGTSTIAARVVQDGELKAHAVLVLGRDRALAVKELGVPRPVLVPFDSIPPAPPAAGGPPFVRHFDFRMTGPRPFARGNEGRAAGWVRARDLGGAPDAAYLVALADCYWPAIFTVLEAPRPMATITFTLDFVGTFDGLSHDAPVFHEGQMLAAERGFAPELRTIWGPDGRLLAINHQTFCIIQ